MRLECDEKKKPQGNKVRFKVHVIVQNVLSLI
jgi:hypothetical protein